MRRLHNKRCKIYSYKIYKLIIKNYFLKVCNYLNDLLLSKKQNMVKKLQKLNIRVTSASLLQHGANEKILAGK
jgi:hypothetical protein